LNQSRFILATSNDRGQFGTHASGVLRVALPERAHPPALRRSAYRTLWYSPRCL